MEISRRHFPLDLGEVLEASAALQQQVTEAQATENARLRAQLAGMNRNQRRVFKKQLAKAAKRK